MLCIYIYIYQLLHVLTAEVAHGVREVLVAVVQGAAAEVVEHAPLLVHDLVVLEDL